MATPRCAPPAVHVDQRDFSEEAALLKALADPTRLTIVATLARAKGEVCVCDFTAELPINQSSVSHHLRILRDAGIISGVRRGTWVHYSLEPGLRARIDQLMGFVLRQKLAA